MDRPSATRSGRTVYTAQEKPPRRRHVSLWLVIAIVLVAVIATAAWQFTTAPSIAATTPEPGTFTASHTVPVRVQVKGMQSLKNVVVKVDGRDVTKKVRFGADDLTYTAADLPDGKHTITLVAGTSNLYRQSIEHTWTFTVDSEKPKLHWVAPKNAEIFTTDTVTVSGDTETKAEVYVSDVPVEATTRAAADGSFSMALTLPDGRYRLTVNAKDAAGNVRSASRRVAVNVHGPVITVPATTTLNESEPTIQVTVKAPVPRPVLTVTVDGEQVFEHSVAEVTDLKLGDITDGKHTLVFTATDKVGKVATQTQDVVVDTSEKLGETSLSIGAVGQDVKDLQQLLVDNKVYRYTPNGVFTSGVKRSIERFQKRLGQTVTGVADPKLIAALNGRIVVDQGECRLYFYLKGKLKKTYPVAVGQPAWPTPDGTFEVLIMAENPTWIPPDSPWAKGLEPVPPGAGNPLGTRWIGTSAPGVGIHGTPSSWSIGSHASHGCIRMYISDVEELYEFVQVGMPVIIHQ
jgi:lipoprotein-anchoring transpeptidase ErfK/SrfK